MSAPVDIHKPELASPAEDDTPRRWDQPGRCNHDQEPALDWADTDDHDQDQEEADDPRTLKALAVIAAVGGTVLAGIGFTGSYNTLRHLAEVKHFGLFSYAFPVGIDAGILVLLALDLYMLSKRMPKPMLRWMAHLLTAATVAFNAAASGPVLADPLAASMHGVIPCLFIAAVEAARHYIGRRADLLAGATPLGTVPISRWILAPVATPRLARRMRLYNLPYAEAAAQDQQLRIYREGLKQKYGKASWRTAATPDELLPFKLARFGFSVERSLAVPLLEETKQRQREAEAAFQRAEAEIQKVEADVQIRTAQIQAEVQRIKAEGELEIAKAAAEKAAQAEIQKAEAAFQLAEAERQADLELVQERAQARAAELVAEAEQRRVRARIEAEKEQVNWQLEQQKLRSQATEEQRRQQAEAALQAAREEADRKAATAAQQRRIAEDDAARAKAAQEAAEGRAHAAESHARELKAAEEAQRRREEIAASKAREAAALEAEAERRARVAEYEARAVEAAAKARMPQAEWDAHRVAAMIRARGADAVTTKVIEAELGVSAGTAHDRKQRALQLLEEEAAGARQATAS